MDFFFFLIHVNEGFGEYIGFVIHHKSFISFQIKYKYLSKERWKSNAGAFGINGRFDQFLNFIHSPSCIMLSSELFWNCLVKLFLPFDSESLKLRNQP